jgi:exopolyphosphatase / guanosine-5'-triphosphate,3'-diphosphate pyrophosphatase
MPPVVGAAIDVGSNSVHLLVATVANHRLTTLADESVFLGLGAAVAQRGHLGVPARVELAEALSVYARVARDLGASEVTVAGTEPIRRAADAPTIVHQVGSLTGLAIHVLTHEEEAFLTAVGVMAGRLVSRETLVVDVGGGSSEFCVVRPDGPPRAAGLRVGAARLTDRHVRHDPPTAEELYAMLEDARRGVAAAPPAAPQEIVAVGGTVSNLLKVIRFGASKGTLTRDKTARALALLAAEPIELAAKRHGIRPERARILPAGAVIVDAILRHYGADSLRVSEAGIREGAILAAAHAGRSWRDRLPVLAQGWRA